MLHASVSQFLLLVIGKLENGKPAIELKIYGILCCFHLFYVQIFHYKHRDFEVIWYKKSNRL
jgi:hypothetical protein